MGIWSYDHLQNEPPHGVWLSVCLYCQTELMHLFPDGQRVSATRWSRQWNRLGQDEWSYAMGVGKWVDSCEACGWWSLSSHAREGGLAIRGVICRAGASLYNFNPADLSVPIGELNQYLTAKFEVRFEVNPRQYELIVADVFRSAGYYVISSSLGGDEGIDAFAFANDSSEVFAIQVKRWRRPIQGEQIRAFGGALMQAGLTRGVYVTTSRFSRGGKKAATDIELQYGVAIKLVDAERFYEALRLSRRSRYLSFAERQAPWLNLDARALKPVAEFRWDHAG
jgi:hypothetical protein